MQTFTMLSEQTASDNAEMIAEIDADNAAAAQMAQYLFEAAISIYEAALVHGVDDKTFKRMSALMTWIEEMAEEHDYDVSMLDGFENKLKKTPNGYVLDSEQYDEDAEWAEIDNS